MIKTYGVHDHWTDIAKKNDIDIMSVDGVIEEIKVNGEAIGGGGSSDFSTAEVTIVNTGESTWALVAPIVLEEGTQTYPIGMYSAMEGIIAGNMSNVVKLALFKGHAYIDTMANPFTINSTSGNITLNNDICDITGDCTITIS